MTPPSGRSRGRPPVPFSVLQEIVRLRRAGGTFKLIGTRLGIPWTTARNVYYRTVPGSVRGDLRFAPALHRNGVWLSAERWNITFRNAAREGLPSRVAPGMEAA